MNKPFTLYWRDGRKNVVHGEHAADAMNRAGYGRGALPALDFWANGVDADYVWSAEKREWVSVNEGAPNE